MRFVNGQVYVGTLERKMFLRILKIYAVNRNNSRLVTVNVN